MGAAKGELAEQLTRLCAAAIGDEVFPGCELGYIRGDDVGVIPFGRQTYDAKSPVVTADTVYDVASVTKAVATASMILSLIDKGRLSLDDRVVDYLPEMTGAGRAGMLVRHLLTYTVVLDLPAGLSEAARRSPETLMDLILQAPLKAPPGEAYHYTNFPAILLGLIAERVAGKPLAAAVKADFFGPLGMPDSSFDPADKPTVAPTEIIGGAEVRGVVHDEAARALQGQGLPGGCAGLFSTAGDLLRFAQMILNDGQLDGRRYFEAETVEQMRTNQLSGIGKTAGLGWEIYRPDVMGKAQRDGMMMKSGFTGCWIVIDPAGSRALVHLSNRTYPHRGEREPIQAFWRGLNEAFFGV